MVRLFGLLLLLMAQVSAAELDETYYPSRLQWYSIEKPKTEDTFIWQHGLYLRLRFDDEPSQGSLWLLGKGNLFKKLKPRRYRVGEQWHWLFDRNGNQSATVLLEDFDQLPQLIEQARVTRAPALKVVAKQINHHDSVNINRTEGFHQQDYDHFPAAETLQYKLQGPGQFYFRFRTPWQVDYGAVELLELFIKQNQNPDKSQIFKAQPEPNYLLQTPWCECLYSRQISAPLLLDKGEHTIEIKADREIIGFWTKDSQDQAYLLAHNGHLDKAIIDKVKPEKGGQPQLYFYRQLDTKTPSHLRSMHTDKGTQIRFSEISGRQTQQFIIPNTSRNPPLRVMIHPDSVPAKLTVTTDGGESVQLYYSHRDEENNQLPLHYIQLTRPFTSVTVKNHLSEAAAVNIGYKNLSRYTSPENNFIQHLSPDTALKILQRLKGNKITLSSTLLSQEVMDWQTRINARAESFESRYQSNAIAGTSIDSVHKAMRNLSQLTGQNIESLPQLIAVMEKLNLKQAARRWLTFHAMEAQSPFQQDAEKLLLEKLALEEKWFDVEGYWAYRLTRMKENTALLALAKVALRQNRFGLAAKWFWISEQLALYQSAPIEGLLSAHQAGYQQMEKYWLQQHPDIALPQHWYYWQKVAPDLFAATKLVHNKGLDSYFDTISINAKQTYRFSLPDAGRYKLTLYGNKAVKEKWAGDEKLTLSLNHQQQQFELSQWRNSLSLISATEQSVLGSPKTIIFTLPPSNSEGDHSVSIQLSQHNALFTLEKLSDLMADRETQKAPVTLANHRLKPTESKRTNISEETLFDRKDHRWARLQNIMQSAGQRTVSADRWQGQSQSAKLQQALLVEAIKPGERLLSQQAAEVLQIQTGTSKQLTLSVREIHRFGYPISPTKIQIEHNGEKRSLILPQKLTFNLAPGEHNIRLSLANEQGYIRGKKVGNKTNTWVFFRVDGLNMPEVKRRYHAATAERPLKVKIPQDSWIRVDKADGSSNIQYYKSPAELTLTNISGQNETLYQLYRWQPVHQSENESSVSQQVATQSQPLTAAAIPLSIHYWPLYKRSTLQVIDKYQADQQQDGSWGFSGGYRQRRNFDENEQTTQEQFYHLGWSYRLNLPDWQSHYAGDVSVRAHQDTGLKTLIMENNLIWRQNRYRDHSAKANLYHQLHADDPAIKGATSGYFSLTTNWRQYWDNDMDNRITLSAFTRYLSLNESDIYPGNNETPHNNIGENGASVDDDVYSDYKEDNPRGLRLGNVWQYKPYLDTRLRLAASMTSNKDFNLFDPQSLSISAGFRQYYEPFFLGMDFRHVRFKRQPTDFDTANVRKRNYLRLSMDFEHWRLMGELGQVSLFATSDLDSGQSAFGINFHWYLTEGQGYDDFAPSQLIFGNLRKRMGFHRIETNEVIKKDHE